jgi:hypothetical protein
MLHQQTQRFEEELKLMESHGRPEAVPDSESSMQEPPLEIEEGFNINRALKR